MIASIPVLRYRWFMRQRDTLDVHASLIAVAADAVAIYCGFMLATWIRFFSNWVSVPYGVPADVHKVYSTGSAVATLLFLFVFRSLELYARPQTGSYSDKIPRLIRATGLGVLLSAVGAFAVRNLVYSFSTGVLILSFFTITVLLLIERYILFRLEGKCFHRRCHT